MRAALALVAVEGLGPRRIRLLVDACGSGSAVLQALARGRLPEIEDPKGRTRLGSKLRARLSRLRPLPEGALTRLEARGVRLIVRGMSTYPSRLDHLHDPPPVLWLLGPGRLPTERAVAVVGTRKATAYGRRIARELAGDLARHGWVVVSGMAAGIDGASHLGALDAGGASVGVLGSGLDHVYPKGNADLYRRMRREGLLVSEFPSHEPPRRGSFPRRNRIIAALCEGVVVVQAGKPSGALITADHALDLGREVFAMPGPVGAPGSTGVHGLIRDGAVLVEGAADVLQGLGLAPERGASGSEVAPGSRPADQGSGEQAVWRRLDEGPRAVDQLAVEAGLPVSQALALLSRLELQGAVRRLPGGRYERASSSGGAAAR